MEWIEIEVPAGWMIHEGVAAPINTNAAHLLEGPTDILQGRGNQIYIEGEILHSWLQNSGGF